MTTPDALAPNSAPVRYPAEAELLSQAAAGQPAAVDRVLSQLGSANPWLQQIMLEAITDCADPHLWERLLGCLALRRWGGQADCHRRQDPAASLRVDAALTRALVDDTPGAASTAIKLAVLERALDSSDAKLTAMAAIVLGQRGDRRALPRLVSAVQAGELETRRLAVLALAKLDDERGRAALLEALSADDDSLHTAASQALAEMGARAAPAWVQALRSPRAHVRWHAAHGLADLVGAVSAAKPLAESLADDDYSVRWAAAEALVNVGPAAVPAILSRLTRYVEHPDTYAAAGHALRHLAQGDLYGELEPLLAALHGPAASVHVPGEAYKLLVALKG